MKHLAHEKKTKQKRGTNTNINHETFTLVNFLPVLPTFINVNMKNIQMSQHPQAMSSLQEVDHVIPASRQRIGKYWRGNISTITSTKILVINQEMKANDNSKVKLDEQVISIGLTTHCSSFKIFLDIPLSCQWDGNPRMELIPLFPHTSNM